MACNHPAPRVFVSSEGLDADSTALTRRKIDGRVRLIQICVQGPRVPPGGRRPHLRLQEGKGCRGYHTTVGGSALK